VVVLDATTDGDTTGEVDEDEDEDEDDGGSGVSQSPYDRPAGGTSCTRTRATRTR